MTIRKSVCCAALALSVSLAPLFASAPSQDGNANAAARITEAMNRQTQRLTALMSKLPAEAMSGIQQAINAQTQGRDKALAELASHSGSTTSTTGSTTPSTPDSAEAAGTQEGADTKTTGLMHARDTVSAAFTKSETNLQNVIAKLPEKAVPHVQAALAKIQADHARTVQNLDNLIAKQTVDRASMDLPNRPDRPSHPDKMDRPTLPDRPQKPEHPQAPGKP